jgi:hypothetical protein
MSSSKEVRKSRLLQSWRMGFRWSRLTDFCREFHFDRFNSNLRWVSELCVTSSRMYQLILSIHLIDVNKYHVREVFVTWYALCCQLWSFLYFIDVAFDTWETIVDRCCCTSRNNNNNENSVGVYFPVRASLLVCSVFSFYCFFFFFQQVAVWWRSSFFTRFLLLTISHLNCTKELYICLLLFSFLN